MKSVERDSAGKKRINRRLENQESTLGCGVRFAMRHNSRQAFGYWSNLTGFRYLRSTVQGPSLKL